MKTVTLFRHAKSDWKDSPTIADIDRPLSERGLKAAPRMGQALHDRSIEPDLILCSPSIRTRQTLELASAVAWDREPEVKFDAAIYEAGVWALMSALNALPATCGHAMIVGHNPGLHNLALRLAGEDAAQAAGFDEKFPTAAILSFSLDVEVWTEDLTGKGKVMHYMTPKTERDKH